MGVALILQPFVYDASAQVIGRPPRSVGGLFGGRRPADPNRTQQELVLTVDFLGGYDDHLTPDGESSAPDPTAPRQSGTTATAAAMLRYQRSRLTRGVEVIARSNIATYRGIDVRPLIGAHVNGRAFGQFFDRFSFSVSGDVGYRPTFMFGAFGPTQAIDAMPPTDPTGGVTEIRSINSVGSANLTYDWSARHHTNGGHTYARMRSYGLDHLGVVDNTSMLSHSWDFARNLGVEGSYSRSHQRALAVTGSSDQSLDTQTASMGVEIRIPVSRTRRISLSGSGGATQVRTFSVVENAPVEYVTPSGRVSVRMDVGRTWAVSTEVNRTVGMLEGLTRQSFVTTSGSLWTGGTLGRRAVVSVTGTYSDGASHAADTGSFSTLGGTAEVQYTVSRCCSVVTSYSFYQHRVVDVAAEVPAGFPRSIDRNAVRVGLSVMLPLYGTFPADGRR
jgi:hypothetical protein